MTKWWVDEDHPSGAKAQNHFDEFCGTDKSVPFQNGGFISNLNGHSSGWPLVFEDKVVGG